MIKVIIFLGTVVLCYGNVPEEGTLHLVYSKMLSEVKPSQPEPRSGVAYVYPITATDLSLVTEYDSLKSPEFSSGEEIDTVTVQKTQSFSKEISVAPKIHPYKDNILVLKQVKDKTAPYLSIDPQDPKVNEFGTN